LFGGVRNTVAVEISTGIFRPIKRNGVLSTLDKIFDPDGKGGTTWTPRLWWLNIPMLCYGGVKKINDFILADDLLDNVLPLGQAGGGLFNGIAEGIKYSVHLFIVYNGKFMLIERVSQEISQILLKILQIFLLGLGKVFVHVIYPLLVQKKITHIRIIGRNSSFIKSYFVPSQR
jgi:hypothetical protein